MKQICNFYVVRLDNKVVEFFPLNDEGYDELLIKLKSECLTDFDIRKCFLNMGEEYIQNQIIDIRKCGCLYYSGRVMCFCFKLSRYKMSIEQKEIEIN